MSETCHVCGTEMIEARRQYQFYGNAAFRKVFCPECGLAMDRIETWKGEKPEEVSVKRKLTKSKVEQWREYGKPPWQCHRCNRWNTGYVCSCEQQEAEREQE